jgi:hypothetical protein
MEPNGANIKIRHSLGGKCRGHSRKGKMSGMGREQIGGKGITFEAAQILQ